MTTLKSACVKLAYENPELRPLLMPLLRSKTATEFPSKEALEKYLKDHPGANRSNHKVVENKGKGEAKTEGKEDSKAVSMSREGYKAIANSLRGFGSSGSWEHVISYAISDKPMERKHVDKVLSDINGYLKNWKATSESNRWGDRDKKSLTRAKGILENWSKK